jgi:hypothetical protein
VCGLVCPTGTLCGESCVNLGGDLAHCGACDNKCSDVAKEPTGIDGVGAPACLNGGCGVACGPARQSCKVEGGFYCPRNNSPRFCGGDCLGCGFGKVCNSKTCKEPACAIDKKLCPNNGVCADLKTDRTNCGICGKVCPNNQVCTNGSCINSTGDNCIPPFEICTSSANIPACVNLNTDTSNCGGCGKMCLKTQACVEGACKDFYNALEPWECSLVPGFTKPCVITMGNDIRIICIPDGSKCALWGGVEG